MLKKQKAAMTKFVEGPENFSLVPGEVLECYSWQDVEILDLNNWPSQMATLKPFIV